jgi:hypothetical protein
MRNKTDEFFTTTNGVDISKSMAVAVSWTSNGINDNWNQIPTTIMKFSIKFAISIDRCPSEGDFWLPRPLGVAPNFNTLKLACTNYNNMSCCNPGSAVPNSAVAGRTLNHALAPDDPFSQTANMNFPIAALFDHQWARNDTECYFYYQVAACASRCSPLAVPSSASGVSWIETNWDAGAIAGPIPGARRTLRLCKPFCQRVWGACQNERIRTQQNSVTPGLGVPLKSLYSSENEFCFDFFNFAYPQSLPAALRDTTGSLNNPALIKPSAQGADPFSVIVELTAAPCFDPSAEPGSASSLAISLLVLIGALFLSL